MLNPIAGGPEKGETGIIDRSGTAVRTFLPYSKIVKMPQSKALPLHLNTLGDHIRKKRIKLNLIQQDAAKIIGVSEDAITHWENNRSQPQIRYYPGIVEFLGYDPQEYDTSNFAGRIKKYRYSKGYSYRQLGDELGVNASTISGWERSLNSPKPHTQIIAETQLDTFLKKQYPST